MSEGRDPDLELIELRSRVEGLIERIDDLEDQLTNGSAARFPSNQETPSFPTLNEWVEGVFATHFTRDHMSQSWFWCPRWWDHVEAVSRLTALWHSWEAMHLLAPAGAGLAAWYHELDHQLPILMGAQGPFRLCRDGSRHVSQELALPVMPAEF